MYSQDFMCATCIHRYNCEIDPDIECENYPQEIKEKSACFKCKHLHVCKYFIKSIPEREDTCQYFEGKTYAYEAGFDVGYQNGYDDGYGIAWDDIEEDNKK